MVVNTTAIEEEIEKFSRYAAEWWDENGKFKLLHKINPLRISFIKEQINKYMVILPQDIKPFKNLRFLDIGCGGGLLTVPMHKLGAEIIGIDASSKNIRVAQNYANNNGLNIPYLNSVIENLDAKYGMFDVILCMEVVEHVADLKLFFNSACELLKPGGLMFVATINRTVKSYLQAIVVAEYIFRWLPVGTHDWHKFLKPSEIVNLLKEQKLALQHSAGLEYNIANNSWNLTSQLDVNYMAVFKKDFM